MNKALIRELELIRDACDEIGYTRNHDDTLKTINQVQQYISKVIVEQSQLSELEKNTCTQLIKITGESTLSNFEDAKRSTNSKIQGADLKHDSDAIAFAKKLVTLDANYWKKRTAAIDDEIQKLNLNNEDGTSGDPTDIDLAALCQFIHDTIDGEDDIGISDVRAASIGNSKATLFISLTGNKVLPNEIVLRKDQDFNFLGTLVVDEFPALQLLYDNEVPVPKPYAVETTGNVLGQPFLLCSKEDGAPMGTIYFPPERNDTMLASLAKAMAKMHCVPINGITSIGADNPQGREHIEHEINTHYKTWQELNVSNPLVETAFAWVRSNMDKAYGNLSIIHNDYSYHNILIENNQVTAILDWEFIHLGNPAADIAYFQVDTEHEHAAGFDFFLNEYQKSGGTVPSKDELDFYYVWAHTRFAIMCTQTKVGVDQGQMGGLRPMMPTIHYLPKPMLCLGNKLGELLG